MTTTINGTTCINKVQPGTVEQGDLAAGVAGNGPLFNASGPIVSIDNNVDQHVIFNAEGYDTNNCYDPVTGRFTPNVPGYYQVGVKIALTDWALPSGFIRITILKNNGLIHESVGGPLNPYAMLETLAYIYMNGTSDYLTVAIGNFSGATHNFIAASFRGHLVRAA